MERQLDEDEDKVVVVGEEEVDEEEEVVVVGNKRAHAELAHTLHDRTHFFKSSSSTSALLHQKHWQDPCNKYIFCRITHSLII